MIRLVFKYYFSLYKGGIAMVYSTYQTSNGIGEGIFLIFVIVIVCICFKKFIEWKNNEDSERLTKEAIIVAKRMQFNHYNHANSFANQTYYITFEFDDGNRVELRMSSKEYGLLAERDKGILTYQGFRFIDFIRIKD